MKFNVTGKLVTTITMEVVCDLDDAEIEVRKKDVLKTLGLPPVWDGDATHWYDEVEDALVHGCPADIKASEGSFTEERKILNEEHKWKIESIYWD